ncbi:MAG: ATP-binding cassette domain-containing protein [Anaerolineales bacterium]
MTNAIEVKGLTKVYPPGPRGTTQVQALDHVDFAVQTGEVFGFLGPNGAGKTTTVNILTTLAPPTSGTARVMGRDVARDAYGVRERIGIVPEISNVYDEYSAWDNLIFTARLYGIPKAEREKRAEELLTAFGLWDKRHALAGGFSKGMRRRLCLAMGLAHRPRVLFLDEPTSGLDIQSVLAIRDTIRQLRENGVTIFMTTHNIEEASLACDRVAIIHRGKIAAIDSPANLKNEFQGRRALDVSFGDGPPQMKTFGPIAGVSDAQPMGEKWRLYTAQPELAIPAVVDWSRANKRMITNLNMVEPTLEEVFLHITGLSPQPQSVGEGQNTTEGSSR